MSANAVDLASGSLTYQFRPESYGARGNGTVSADVTTNGTATITSPTVASTGQAGQFIMIHGANGASSGPLITTISAVTSTGAILAAPAGASVANCPAVWGTDDTAAIQSAVTAAGNYAKANNYLAEVIFGAKIYILGTGPTQIGDGATVPTFNTQIQMPFPAVGGTTQKLIILLTGAGDAGFFQFWNTLVPTLSGTCLVSMLTTSSTPSATFGRQSVIGGPSSGAGFTTPAGGATVLQANTKVLMRGISVWLSIYTNIYAVDFRYLSAARAEKCSCHIFAPTGVNTTAVGPYLNTITVPAFTNSVGTGFSWPVSGNNADTTMDNCAVEGYEVGFQVFDHFAAGQLKTIYTDVALKWDASLGLSGTQHGIFIQSFLAEQYNGGFRTIGGNAQCEINWDTENSGTPTYDVNDSANALWGTFKFGDKVDNRAPIITNASNLKVISSNTATGHVASPPAVPASTVAATLVYRDSMVVVTTGAGVTVSVITVDGTSIGQTVAAASNSVPFWVPSGKTVAMTYAGGTPTWNWWSF